MYENDTKLTSEHTPLAPSSGDTARQRTDPKFVRESFTMRRMHTWQIVALAIVAVVGAALALFFYT